MGSPLAPPGRRVVPCAAPYAKVSYVAETLRRMDHEARLQDLQRRLLDLEAAYERLRLERNEAIRHAVQAGMTYRRIGELTELSVQRVAQLGRGARRESA
jgi:hypothetical protein